jgi:hypothetical protein
MQSIYSLTTLYNNNIFVEREQFLIKQHKAEIQAMTKMQVNQTNDHLDTIIQLEKENQYLRQQQCQAPSLLMTEQQQLPNSFMVSTTTQLCNNAEVSFSFLSICQKTKKNSQLIN